MEDESSARSLEGWERHLGSPVDIDGLRTSLAAGTLVSVAAATAERGPEREAIRVDDTALSHGELDELSSDAAARLTANGAAPGRAVLVVGSNSIGLVVGYLGALKTGAAVSLAAPSIGEAEVAAVIARVDPAAVIASAGTIGTLGASVESIPVLDLDDGGAEVPSPRCAGPVEIGPDTVAHLSYTSGTTGEPKAAPLSHANVLASVRAVMAAWRWTSSDVLVHALPLQHAHGLTAVHLAVIAGSSSVVLSRFDPDSLCRAIAEYRATVLFGVPATYRRMLGWDGFARADLSSLRLVVSGSAPLSPDDSDALTEILGHRPLERYGLTEAGFVLSNLHDGERLPGSVGYPLPGVEVRVVDSRGVSVADGEVGEIVVQGPQVFSGYRGVDRAESFHTGGWLRTGDLAVRAPRTGAFTITGRLKDLIISGGMNVHPREVELVLEATAHVREAAVVGRPSVEWGEEVVAFVVGDGRLDVVDLTALMAARLAPHKRPKHYFVLDDLPRNHMGKLLKSDLRRLAVAADPG